MLSFFLKKNFCDAWDNLFHLLLSNVPLTALLAASYFALSASAAVNPMLPDFAFILCSGIVSVYLFAWGVNARKIADFNSPKWGLFAASLKYNLIKGFSFGLLLSSLTLLARLGITFYLNQFLKNDSYLYLIFAAFIAWFYVWFILAMQWFIPLYFLQEDNTFLKNLKKSFIIFFDNMGFSFFMLLHSFVQLALSFITFGLVPGLNGITLSLTNACRLRLYKYDWLEEHPEFLNDREKLSQVPWEELIAEDKESLGPRNLKSFLMPWK